MQKKLKIAVMALCYAPLAFAQSDSIGLKGAVMSETAFTFTEAQLGEDDDMSQNVSIINSNSNIYASEVGYLFSPNVSIINSNSNIYASEVGYLFSPMRFRYRAYDQRFNDIYINGAPIYDMESGQFRYSWVGGLNQQTRNMESSLPFESNNFSMSAMGGSNNYNFRPAAMPAGHRITLSGANRSYTLRGMYTFNTGLSNKGWAFSGNVTYRWANEGYVEGTFYNSLSYFLGVQKVFGDGTHSLSLVTWGNPTERASQGAGTDEMYWLANDRYYNPYWGYQNGKKRNSRIVHDYSPTALLTWDWNIDDNTKLTTSLMGKYTMYERPHAAMPRRLEPRVRVLDRVKGQPPNKLGPAILRQPRRGGTGAGRHVLHTGQAQRRADHDLRLDAEQAVGQGQEMELGNSGRH